VKQESTTYGLMAEFGHDSALLEAAQQASVEGYRMMDAYTPFPVHNLPEALGQRRTMVPLIVLIGGMIGGLGGYFMQWYAMRIDYPFNIGNRPLNSWPAFIPITFELTVLCAALSAVVGMLALNRLPEPYHPVFNVPEFGRASVDRFFLCIEATDPKFDLVRTRTFLEGLKPLSITEVTP
jgi:Protein of unknown function (DUF3341)